MWLTSGYTAQASARASAEEVPVGCHCISYSQVSQTVGHAVTGAIPTSCSRLLSLPACTSRTHLHTPTSSTPLSLGKRTGPTNCLRTGV